VFWGIDGSDSVAAALAPTCLDGIEQLLQFHLQRTVHVVVYATNADARAALDRDVAPTMLLAPYHAKGESLLAVQAPSVDDMNGDERRMRRHICHELAHTFAAERTGSLKRLGDGNCGMRIASWVDEGFAVVLASRVADQPDVIEAVLRNADSPSQPNSRQGEPGTTELSEDEIAAAFDDFSSPDRRAAFALATVRVWQAVDRHGYRFVFDHLDDVHAWHR
jgi:hypothetical protein